MEEIRLENLLLDLFKEDSIRNKNFSYMSQLSIITIKSLLPMRDEVAVRIDYSRFIEEFKLWFHYRVGENPSLINLQGGVDPNIYWSNKDDSIISRIIPIIMANSKYEIIEEEIIKNVLFTTGNIESLLESLLIGQLIYLIIKKEEKLVDKLKERIIEFAQIEFLNKYEKYYRAEIEKYPGNYKVNFERKKIELLNILNEQSNKGFEDLIDCLFVLEGKEPRGLVGKIINNYLYKNHMEYDLPKFYIDLGDYIERLRKSRIDPAQLEIKEYILPDVFSFSEGEVFFHSLLRESKVIKKEVRNGILTSLVQTRTGMYIFKK